MVRTLIGGGPSNVRPFCLLCLLRECAHLLYQVEEVLALLAHQRLAQELANAAHIGA